MAPPPFPLPLDESDVLTMPPSVVVYGMPGIGKTLAMATTFPGALYVQSSPSILHAAAHWAATHPDKGLKVPARLTLDEKTVKQHWQGSWCNALVDIVTKYVAACDANASPFSGIIFDEWNTLCERLFAELKSDPWGKFRGRSGGVNIFAVFDAFKALHRQVLCLSRRTRRMVGFVAHYQGPKLDEEENSPTRGAIKWPGGPKMPMGLSDQVVELCADADVVLQLVVKDAANGLVLGGDIAPKDTQRVFLTQVDSKWFRKVRGFGVAAEEPFDFTQGKGLRELLLRAGFHV